MEYIVPRDELIQVLKDDLVGIRWDGHSSIPSGLNVGNDVIWYCTSNYSTLKIGDTKCFNIKPGQARGDYAYGYEMKY